MKIKNTYEQKIMALSGEIAAKALKKAITTIKPGVTGLEVDDVVQKEIYKLGGDLSYKTVPGYKYATCITINEGVVHGIPNSKKFEVGDLVSVDLAVVYKGWHTDCAWSVLVNGQGIDNQQKEETEEKQRFLQIGEEALWEAVSQATLGSRVGDISSAIQSKVEGSGFRVVRSLVGHGIGRSLHEDPQIPGFGKAGKGAVLKNGAALAIEVIFAKGNEELILDEDGWTYKTADGSWGGLFEMTVIVGDQKPAVLTDWRKA